ncbi:hypothetical protein [Enterococcus sp. DIV1368e]|uniref:hypothetical protein n=1 Tax=unclassified Enterococcus TaxID=2608891 RepID=UPI003F270ADA
MYKKILQKALILMIYNNLKKQIKILEDTRLGEKSSLPSDQKDSDRFDDRISQRSISISLKGDNNPNWLNDIFRENKEMGLGSFISIISYIKEKYRDFYLDQQFILGDFIDENIFNMGFLLNSYIIESKENDFLIEEFFQAFSDELLDKLVEVLGELVQKDVTTAEERNFAFNLLETLSVDYSGRERIDNNEGDVEDEI